jgi:manganese efflux pump family protein
MPFWTIFLIAIGLAMDCFAVSLGVGTAGTAIGPRPTFRLFFHFGLFQAGMTLLGWLAGKTVVNYVWLVALCGRSHATQRITQR